MFIIILYQIYRYVLDLVESCYYLLTYISECNVNCNEDNSTLSNLPYSKTIFHVILSKEK